MPYYSFSTFSKIKSNIKFLRNTLIQKLSILAPTTDNLSFRDTFAGQLYCIVDIILIVVSSQSKVSDSVVVVSFDKTPHTLDIVELGKIG